MSQTIVDRLGNFQRKLRGVTSLVPSRKLPLLTPAEAFGPDLERFRDQAQSMISWRDKQAQWWQFSGHLTTERGRRYAFQLQFTDRRTQNDFIGALPARWITARSFAAHFSLTDPMNGEASKAFQYAEKGGLLMKSTGFAADDRFHVEVGGWYAYRREDGTLTLFANTPDASLHLDLKTTRSLVYHGQSGYVSRDEDASSFFCSNPRLAASGRLLIDDKLESVTGIVWLDHEKQTAPGRSFQNASSRIALQFETGEDLMIFDQGAATFGTWINSLGQTQHLVASEIKIENTEYWKSPSTAARYPLKRHVRIEPLNLEFDIKPMVPNQELSTRRSTLTSSWEGAITAQSTANGASNNAVGLGSASGFMELFGYDTRPHARAIEFLVG